MSNFYEYIDATDLPGINAGSGGFGLGVPQTQNVGYGLPSFFNTGVNSTGNDGFTLPSPTSVAAGSPAPAAAATTPPPATSANTTPPSPLASCNGVVSCTTAFFNNIGDYALRGVIILLGVIFVAVGLNMFKNSGETTLAKAGRIAGEHGL